MIEAPPSVATTDYCGTPNDAVLESALHRQRVRDGVAQALRDSGRAMYITELHAATGHHPTSIGQMLRSYKRTFVSESVNVNGNQRRQVVDFYPGVR